MRPYFLYGHSRPLTHVLFNDDGDLLFSSGKDNKLQVWNTDTGKRIGSYNCDKGVVWAFDLTKDSQRMVVASADQKFMIFDVETGGLLTSVPEEGPCKFVEWCRRPGGQDKFVIVHGSFGHMSQKSIKVWTLDGGKPRRLWVQKDFDSPVTRAHWGPFDETIISCHEDGNINVWCAESGELLLEGDKGIDSLGHKNCVTCCAFNDDRTLMLTCSSNGVARLWDTVEWKERKRYATDRPLNACAISPLFNKTDETQRCHVLLGGGQAAADVTTTSASEGKFQALLYHMVFEDDIGSIKGHFGPINTLAFAPDGRGYCSGGEDGYLRFYKFDDDYFSEKYE